MECIFMGCRAPDDITVVDMDGQGIYRIVLEPAIYTVDINKIGIDRRDDIPT